jgi:predicted ribosome quality control (RQC) complex YloA/Tae2 family protein
MAFDGIVLAAVTKELQVLIGCRIEKIYQPEASCLVLHLHNRNNKTKLFLSAHPVNGRAHLSQLIYDNPLNPPLFCMLLRKHLEGGKIISISQGENLERCLYVSVEVFDEVGDLKIRQLVIEIMGKHSNIILIDPVSGTIIDSIKRVSSEVSRHREVLPGRKYLAPPAQNKLKLMELTEEQFKTALFNFPLNSYLYKSVVKCLGGISTSIAKGLVLAAGLPLEIDLNSIGDYEFTKLWQQIIYLADIIRSENFVPIVYTDDNKLLDFAAVPFTHCVTAKENIFDSMSQALDYYYEKKMAQEALDKQKYNLHKVLNKELERLYKKRLIQEKTIAQAKDAEPLRLMGELLTANIYRLKKGMIEVTVENFYDPTNGLITIPLERDLSPAQNTQNYFKKYNKAKVSAEKAHEQLLLTNDEISYLESVMQSMLQAETLAEVEEVSQELIKEGYLTQPGKKKGREKKEKKAKTKYLKFLSGAGFPILVGKNNRQNDLLTLKIAKDHDLWFHVKDIPGSHVIVQTNGREVPDSTLEEAALIAAYYSKGQSSSQVPVDWTQKKHVKKPSGARPGQVIYENYKTIFITPDKQLVNELKKVNSTKEG